MKLIFKPINYKSFITAVIKENNSLSKLSDIEIISLKFDNKDDKKRFNSLSIDEQKDYILCGYYQSV